MTNEPTFAGVLAEALVESNLMPRYRDYAKQVGIDKGSSPELALTWAPEIIAALPDEWNPDKLRAALIEARRWALGASQNGIDEALGDVPNDPYPGVRKRYRKFSEIRRSPELQARGNAMTNEPTTEAGRDRFWSKVDRRGADANAEIERLTEPHRECGKPKFDGCFSHWPTPHCRACGNPWPCDVENIRQALATPHPDSKP